MTKSRDGGKAKEWQIGESAVPCYSLADAARILGRSRPTLMRWLSSLGEATGHSPIKDATGRWFVPVSAVARLQSEPAALQKLVASAARGRSESLRSLREELATCRAKVAQLEGEVQRLQAASGGHGHHGGGHLHGHHGGGSQESPTS